MNEAKLRAWWFFRQGLDGSLKHATPTRVLERSGWARSVAGVGPYLTLFSRAKIGRAATDAAVAQLELHELPAARGCTYVVPAADFALALKLAQEFSDAPMQVARKLGVTDGEIEDLIKAVNQALAKGPLDPDQIRTATGQASRSLGEAGKKKGVTTTLPLALGKMQGLGLIRRISTNGRLDQQRYLYARWSPNPLKGFKLSIEEARIELARRFFHWVGAATLAEFQAFGAFGVKASKDAVAPLQLVPLEAGDERLATPEARDEYARFSPPSKPAYRLLASLDALFLLRSDLKSVVDPTDWKQNVLLGDARLTAGRSLKDLPSHAIVDRGRLVGLWEYDVDTQSIAWCSFGVKDRAIQQAVAETETYVRDELGDARSFSLDSPKSRLPRIAALRNAK